MQRRTARRSRLIGTLVIVALVAPSTDSIRTERCCRNDENDQQAEHHPVITFRARCTDAHRALFLPFLLHGKGGTESTVGIGLALLFIGGALGKARCDWLGQRLGIVWSVIATETATAVLMVTTMILPLGAVLAILPVLGMVLNGTSSVLYGTVPELAKKDEVGRAFTLFYTGVIGAGGIAPIAYGTVADHTSRAMGVSAAALMGCHRAHGLGLASVPADQTDMTGADPNADPGRVRFPAF